MLHKGQIFVVVFNFFYAQSILAGNAIASSKPFPLGYCGESVARILESPKYRCKNASRSSASLVVLRGFLDLARKVYSFI